MRLFVFSDSHGIKDFSYFPDDVDIYVCLGDITYFGSDLKEILDSLYSQVSTKNKPLLMIHGNHEEHLLDEIIKWTSEKHNIRLLHKGFIVINDLCFVGYGGSTYGSGDYEIKKFFNSINYEKQIWLFHEPPLGCGVDLIPGFGEVGCVTKRELLEQKNPALVFCGHVHECHGIKCQVNNTVIVNTGPKGVIIDINEFIQTQIVSHTQNQNQ